MLSIVIPIGPDDWAWIPLIKELANLAISHEIILSGADSFSPETRVPQITSIKHLKVVRGCKGRAFQLNRGAKAARGSWVWFLHADSRLTPGALGVIQSVGDLSEQAVHYFDLKFFEAGRKMRLNEWGVILRSRSLALPFGDQALLMSKSTWKLVGGFPEDVSRGEDHIFIWYCHQKNVKVLPVHAVLETSARRYSQQGWGYTTFDHFKLAWSQAFPEAIKVIRIKWKRKTSELQRSLSRLLG